MILDISVSLFIFFFKFLSISPLLIFSLISSFTFLSKYPFSKVLTSFFRDDFLISSCNILHQILRMKKVIKLFLYRIFFCHKIFSISYYNIRNIFSIIIFGNILNFFYIVRSTLFITITCH